MDGVAAAEDWAGAGAGFGVPALGWSGGCAAVLGSTVKRGMGTDVDAVASPRADASGFGAGRSLVAAALVSMLKRGRPSDAEDA